MPLFLVSIKEQRNRLCLVSAQNREEIKKSDNIDDLIVNTFKDKVTTLSQILNGQKTTALNFEIACNRYYNYLNVVQKDFSHGVKKIDDNFIPIPDISSIEFEKFPKYILVFKEMGYQDEYEIIFNGCDDLSILNSIDSSLIDDKKLIGVYDLDEKNMEMKQVEYKIKLEFVG